MKFQTDNVKMREIRKAENSNSDAIDLMCSHALYDDGTPMEFEKAQAAFDEMDLAEFIRKWQAFIQAGIPNMSGRRL